MKKNLLKVLILSLFVSSLCGCANTAQNAGSTDPDLDAKPDLDSDAYYAKLVSSKEQIESITDFKPEIVLVPGSGLGDLVKEFDEEVVIPYGEIEGWAPSTAPQHTGNLIFANYNGLNIAVMQGRLHYYEGYSMAEIVFPLRVLHMLGADTVILTNSVGSMNEDFKVGDFVCVRDHISSFVGSPLRGENIDELGERFPSATDIYDKELQDIVLGLGKELDIPVHSGIFVQTQGPQYETPAEINMYKMMGADTVGMSTAVEAIAAGHMGMRVCCINSVTNMASGIGDENYSSDSIYESAAKTGETFALLIKSLLKKL